MISIFLEDFEETTGYLSVDYKKFQVFLNPFAFVAFFDEPLYSDSDRM